MELSRIFIPTFDKARSLRFLTAIFECEVLSDEQDIKFTKIGSTNLYFTETSNPIGTEFPYYSFKVDNSEQLDHIKSKIEFFCYREDLEVVSIECDHNSLNFNDLDGNLWKIEAGGV